MKLVIDAGISFAEYVSYSLDQYYQHIATQLNAKYMSAPSYLAPGLSEYEPQPNNYELDGHTWTVDENGYLSHCDKVPIGQVIL